MKETLFKYFCFLAMISFIFLMITTIISSLIPVILEMLYVNGEKIISMPSKMSFLCYFIPILGMVAGTVGAYTVQKNSKK